MQIVSYNQIVTRSYDDYLDLAIPKISAGIRNIFPRCISEIVAGYAIMNKYEHFAAVIELVTLNGDKHELASLVWEYNSMNAKIKGPGLMSNDPWIQPNVFFNETIDEFDQLGPKLMTDVMFALGCGPESQNYYDKKLLMKYEYQSCAEEIHKKIKAARVL